jgi:GntR family transcriptional regulator, transcriptional repressor for pyruvate dehydrogenase complex
VKAETPSDAPLLSLPTAPRENLSARSALILKQYLLSEPIKPGDRLPPERRLAEALNVSRTVLREAINQLVGEGLVRRDPSRSPTVADFDRERVAREMSMLDESTEIHDLLELRVLLELGAIDLIVKRATAEDLAEVERWVVEGERRLAAAEPLSLPEAKFHAALLRTLGNRSIDGLMPLVEEHMRSNLLVDPHELAGLITDNDHRSIAEHRQIFEAVKRGDAKAAREIMVAHLSGYLHPTRQDEHSASGG